MVEYEKGEPIIIDEDDPVVDALKKLNKTYESPKSQGFRKRLEGVWLDG